MAIFKRTFLFILAFSLIYGITACDDDDDNPAPSSGGSDNQLQVAFQHTVNGDSLMFNEQRYTNAAGEQFGVTKLEYIVTDFRFYRQDQTYAQVDTSLYVNPGGAAGTSFTLNAVPSGDYEAVSFVFGIQKGKNQTGNLPSTNNFANMGWPSRNGGGYHYMRMNGTYTADSIQGVFTTHLGNTKQWALDTTINGATDTAILLDETVEHFAFEVKLGNSAIDMTNGDARLVIEHNLANWYQNPNTYSFAALQSPGIMRKQNKQQALMENGMRDVFSLVELTAP